MCDSLTINCHIHLRQLLFIELVYGQLDWTDGVEQVAVALETSLGGDGGVLCADETFAGEGADVLVHRVDTQLSCCADGSVAGPALMGAPVRAAEQAERKTFFGSI